jgi:hypothetical protein
VPPLAVNVAEYEEFTMPVCSDGVMTWSCVVTRVAPAAIVMLKVFDAVCSRELESCTATLKEKEPERVGVPLIWPDDSNPRPAGKEPDEIDHE